MSQQLRLNLYRAHVSDVAVTTSYDASTISPKVESEGSQSGAGFEMVFNNIGSIELLYMRQGLMRRTDEKHEANLPALPVAVNYMLLSAGGHVENCLGEIQGYGAVLAGMSFARSMQPSTDVLEKKIAWGGRMGCTWWVGKAVGLRVESLFLFSQSPDYKSASFSPANPFCVTSVHQVSMAAGLMFKLTGK